MPGVQVCLVHGVIGVECHGFRVRFYGAPEIGDEAIQVVYRFNRAGFWTLQQHRSREGEGFNVITHLAKSLPYHGGNLALPPECGEWCFEYLSHFATSKTGESISTV